MTICYKMGNVQDTALNQETPNNFPPEVPKRTKPVSPSQPTAYPKLSDTGSDHDYEIILPNRTPIRPAPGPPMPATTNSTASSNTLGTYAALEGVPFVLNSRLQGGNANVAGQSSIPVVCARTMSQLDREYHYDFRAERHS